MFENKRSIFLSISCFILLLCVYLNTWGQPKSRIDSLYDELVIHSNEVADDTDNVRKYYEYAILCSENEGAWDSAKEPSASYSGFYMSIRLGYEKGINDFIGVLKTCFRQREGMPRITIRTYPDAVSRDTLRLLHQARKQKHGGTVDWYRNAFDIYKGLHRYREAGIVRFWNALAYYDSESFIEAMRLFEQAGIYFTLAEDHTYLLKLALYKGCTHYYQKNYLQALKEFNKAKVECVRIKDTSSLALTLYNRGEIHIAMQNHQQALEDFSEAFRLEQMNGDTSRNISGRIKIARAYFALNKFSECIRELKTALTEAAVNVDKNGEADGLYLLSLALMKTGDDRSAAKYMTEFVSLRDSLFTAELSGFMKNREYFWINKLGRQITNQTHIDHERNAYFIQLRKNKFFIWGILILTLLLSLIGVLLFHSNRSNKKANEYLRELDQTRNLFFSIIAHDLRGPLFASDLLLKPAIQKAEQLGQEDLTSSLKEIGLQNNRRRLLLDNLLSWASIQRGSLKCNPQKVGIPDIFDHAVNLYSPAAKQKGSIIKQGKITGEYILADPDMMDLIMRNLIDNSLKHGEAGMEISLEGCLEGANMLISIADNGPGIDQEVIDRFMNKNSKHDIGSNNRLGLSLIRFFIELQGGKIRIERQKKGTRISFTMPLYKN